MWQGSLGAFLVDADGIFLHVVKGHMHTGVCLSLAHPFSMYGHMYKTATAVDILADEQLCNLPTLRSLHLHCEQVESRISNEQSVKAA